MKRLFLFSSIFLVLAQGAVAHTATMFNNRIQTIVDSIDILENDWSRQYADISTDDKNFSLLGPVRMRMELYLDQKAEELENMEDVYGSKRLRMAVLDYITVEKELLKNALVPIEKLSSTISPVVLADAARKLTIEAGKEDDQLDLVTNEQQDYAKRNGNAIPEMVTN